MIFFKEDTGLADVYGARVEGLYPAARYGVLGHLFFLCENHEAVPHGRGKLAFWKKSIPGAS